MVEYRDDSPFESEGYFLILIRESEVKRNIRGEVTKSS